MAQRMEPKRHKVMEIELKGREFYCIKDNTDPRKLFKVYLRWYKCGPHQKKLKDYADMYSVVYYLRDIIEGRAGF